MTKRKRQDSSVVITLYGAEGVDHEYQVVSTSGQIEVKALVERLAQQWAEPITMDDVLRDLGVPKEHQGECAEMIAMHLTDCVNEGQSTSIYAPDQWVTMPRDIVRKFLPPAYEGSWLERWLMGRHTFFQEGYGLRYLAEMVQLIGESFDKADGDVNPAQAASLLSNLAGNIRMAAELYDPDDKQDATTEPTAPERVAA